MASRWAVRAAKATVVALGGSESLGGHMSTGDSARLGRTLDRCSFSGERAAAVTSIEEGVELSLDGSSRRDADDAARLATVAIARRSLTLTELIVLGFNALEATEQVMEAAQYGNDQTLDPDAYEPARNPILYAYARLCARLVNVPRLLLEHAQAIADEHARNRELAAVAVYLATVDSSLSILASSSITDVRVRDQVPAPAAMALPRGASLKAIGETLHLSDELLRAETLVDIVEGVAATGDTYGAQRLAGDASMIMERDKRRHDTFSIRHYLGHMRGLQGDPAGAVADLEDLFEKLTRHLGPDHPHTLRTCEALTHWRSQVDGAEYTWEQPPSSSSSAS